VRCVAGGHRPRLVADHVTSDCRLAQ
jgi:hypothetical protein